jgi:hypothetical protein
MPGPGGRLFAWRPTTLHVSSLFPVRRHVVMHGLAGGPAVKSLRLCCASVVVLLLALEIAHAQSDANGDPAAVAMADPFAGFAARHRIVSHSRFRRYAPSCRRKVVATSVPCRRKAPWA